jgi:hypothetical protein
MTCINVLKFAEGPAVTGTIDLCVYETLKHGERCGSSIEKLEARCSMSMLSSTVSSHEIEEEEMKAAMRRQVQWSLSTEERSKACTIQHFW